ncbi:MAG: bifunctional nuclease family protein [Deferribacteres bacterium]|nr:bifunctional nuclease family protein [Deferribacteres bacterium]
MKKILFIAIFIISFAVAISCSSPNHSSAIQVEVHAIHGDPHSGPVLIYLTTQEKDRFLSMMIDGDQALSIYYARNAIKPQRPLTHDLFTKLIDTLNYHIDFINITGVKEDTYYAAIHLSGGKNKLVLDARPSDAIALALRQDARIYCSSVLLKSYEVESDDIAGIRQFQMEKFGFTVQNLSKKMKEFFQDTEGLLISDIRLHSRAARSDLQAGDIITGINGYPAINISDFKAIVTAIGDENILLDIVRDGEQKTVELKNNE